MGISKTLQALVESHIDAGDFDTIVHVDPGDLEPDPLQPRRTFAEQPLTDLADNISARGIQDPIKVTYRDGALVIKHGERRWRAAQIAGLKVVPCLLELDDEAPDRFLDQIANNLLREDVPPLDLAEGLKRLRDEGMSVADIARRFTDHGIKRDRSTISNTIRLLDLPEWAKDDLRLGHYGVSAALHILRAARHPRWLEIVEQELARNRDRDGKITELDFEPFSVDALSELVDSAPGFDKGVGSLWHEARFDVAEICAGCEHYIEVSDGRKYCFNRPEMERRNKEADKATGGSVDSAVAQTNERGRVETDPTKVKPRKIKETSEGLVKLRGRPSLEYRRLNSADFDVDAAGCEGCQHRKLGNHSGHEKDGAPEPLCFYPPCYEKLSAEAHRLRGQSDKIRLALDELLKPYLDELLDVQPADTIDALLLYAAAALPLEARKPREEDYLGSVYVHHDDVSRNRLADALGLEVLNLSYVLGICAMPARRDAFKLRAAKTVAAMMDAEQRRELAFYLNVQLDTFYRRTESLAKIYQRADLCRAFNELGVSVSSTAKLSELREMYLAGEVPLKPELEAWRESRIGNVVVTKARARVDDGEEDEAA